MKSKIVIITGAATGIGYELSLLFCKQNYIVIITDINEQKLTESLQVLRSINPYTQSYTVDISDKNQVFQFANHIIDTYGKIDILVNNAGVGFQAELAETSLDDWEKLIDVNLYGSLHHIYAFLPYMKKAKKGQIINISSGQSFFKMPSWGAYASVKLCLGTMSEILHYELQPYGIDVTTVYPYMVQTDFYKEIHSQNIISNLAIQLLPLYSQKSNKVAQIIFKAIQTKKKIEMVHPLNWIAKQINHVPISSTLLNKSLSFALGNQSNTMNNKNIFLQEMLFKSYGKWIEFKEGNGKIGFQMTEKMKGSHQFLLSESETALLNMEFELNWGHEQMIDFFNPYHEDFLKAKAEGWIYIEGFCDKTPCSGTLSLRYFDLRKILYRLEFTHQNKEYIFKGEKRDIYPWNLAVTHRKCYGELISKDDKKLISSSETFFNWSEIPYFIKSFSLKK